MRALVVGSANKMARTDKRVSGAQSHSPPYNQCPNVKYTTEFLMICGGVKGFGTGWSFLGDLVQTVPNVQAQSQVFNNEVRD